MNRRTLKTEKLLSSSPSRKSALIRDCPNTTTIRHEKRSQTQTFESGYFRWGRGLPHEGVGAQKVGMSLEAQEIKRFWQDIPGFCWDIPAVPEKFENKKSLCSMSGPYTTIIFQKSFASDATPKWHLVAHQMKDLCGFSVFHCV